jgi:hypothetical protein
MKNQLLRRGCWLVAVGAFVAGAGSWSLPIFFARSLPASSTSRSLADGSYLYGEVPEPDQIGKGYVVFTHQDTRVSGALYHPHSEFDCFSGSLINLLLDVQATALGTPETVPLQVDLSQLYPIQPLQSQDHQLLAACQGMISGQPLQDSNLRSGELR